MACSCTKRPDLVPLRGRVVAVLLSNRAEASRETSSGFKRKRCKCSCCTDEGTCKQERASSLELHNFLNRLCMVSLGFPQLIASAK